jgi:hypothetical protein
MFTFANGCIVGLALIGALAGHAYSQAGRESLATPAEAISDRFSNLEGNWSVEWHDYPEKGQVTAAKVVLMRNWEQKCVAVPGGGCSFLNSVHQTDTSWNAHYTSDLQNWGGGSSQVSPQGNLEIHWGWGGRSELRQTGLNELRGRWSWTDRGGAEVWRRASPRITRVVFRGVSYWGYDARLATYDAPSSQLRSEWPGETPSRVEGTYGGNWGPGIDMRGKRPTFKVEIYGENLWGHHIIDVGGAVDLEPLSYWTYIMQDGGRYSSLANRVQEVEGIELTVVIWSKVRPGTYALRVDGISIPFEIVTKGYPGTVPKVAEINFLRKTDEGFEPVTGQTLSRCR